MALQTWKRLSAGGALVAGWFGLAVGGEARAACPTLDLVKPGTLTMSINATIPPTQYIDKSGKVVGQNVELAEEIAKRLCLKPEHINIQFEAQIPGLQTKRWDMINTGLFFTPERAKVMYLVPYSVSALGIIAQEGNPLGIKGPKDVAGKPVGVEIGGFEEKLIRKVNEEQVAAGLPAMDLRVFNTYGDTFQALQAGQVVAVFAGDTIGTFYQKQGRFTIAAAGLFPGNANAFATIDKTIGEAVAAALNEMKADGTYQKIMTSYGTTMVDKWGQWEGAFKAYHTN